jgi:TP901 family phage tail tape measure protein
MGQSKMAGEVATAFVTLVPSAKGFGAATAAQLSGQVTTAGAAAGTKAGAAMGAGMGAKFAKIAGPAALAAGAAMGAKAAIGVSASFEESQNVLQAAIGASAAEMTQLAGLARQMGASTVFSSQDASDAMVELAKAGLSVGQIMGGGVQSAMALAATEGLALSDAAVAVSNAMSAFGLNASDLPNVADALAGASKASTASVSSLMQALQQVGPGARAAGMTLEDTVAVLAAFDNMGIKGSDAGTSLKTMLQRLVPQTKKAREAFLKYNLAVYDAGLAQENFAGLIDPKSWGQADVEMALADMFRANGLKGAQIGKAVDEAMWEASQNLFTNQDGSFKNVEQWAGLLKDALGGLGEVDLTEATNLLFGSDAGRAGTILAALGVEGFQPFIDGTNEAGVAAEMADARTKGLNGAMEALGGSIENLGISVGTVLLPALTDAVSWLADEFVPALTTAFDSIPWPTVGRWFGLAGQWATTWAGLVLGAVRSAYNGFYWMVTGLLELLSSLPLIGPQFGEALNTIRGDNETVNSWFDGVEAGLSDARTSIDLFMTDMESRQWLRDYKVRTQFTYYDPVTGTYSKSGGAQVPIKRPAPPKTPRTAAAADAPRGTTNNVYVTNPKPEKASDSVPVALRRVSSRAV